MNVNNNNHNHNRRRINNRGQRVMFPRESLRRRRSSSVHTAIEYSEAEAVSRRYMTASINNRLCRLSINQSTDSLINPIFPDDNMTTLRHGEQASLLATANQQLKMIVDGTVDHANVTKLLPKVEAWLERIDLEKEHCVTLLSDIHERKIELEEETKRLKEMEAILACTTTADKKCNGIM